MSSDIQWEDPPEHALTIRRKTTYTDFAQALRQRPGQWAIAPGERASADSAKNTAANILNGRMKDFPKGECQAVVDGPKLYVRYRDPVAVEHEGGGEEIAVGSQQHRAADVRAWAKENGFSDIGDKGRLPQHVIAAFEEAQDGPEG